MAGVNRQRHAEKRRTATCEFANRVARTSVDHYNSKIKNTRGPIVLSTIVTFDGNELQVISMGVGTKFISRELASDTNRLRDCHAEVLAKRGLQRVLWEDLIRLKEGKQGVLLEKTEKYKLRHGWTLHMYSSSAPCGNATLKKFNSMSKEVYLEHEPQWPVQEHTTISLHSIHLGQAALLCKRDALVVAREDERGPILPGKARNWPIYTTTDWCPPGTCPPWHSQAGWHSCSDKILRWNMLGWQGSLLSKYCSMKMTSITVGRKFSFEICRRALCCRGLDNHVSIMGTSVYLDDRVLDQDDKARFGDDSCWLWWLGLEEPEQINGQTGYLVNDRASRACSRAFWECLDEVEGSPQERDKSKVVPEQEIAKDQLLFKHRVLRDWKRR